MGVTLHTIPITLKEFFEGKPLTTNNDESSSLKQPERKIEIPRIQRAYAQGRTTTHANRTRDRFLTAIQDHLVKNKKMTLDFVYGNINNDKLIPLDGQQRLTTLFLLHWYASRKDINARAHVMFERERFNYMTRYSSRDFLIRLMTYSPDLGKGHAGLSYQIKETQGWYLTEWSKDPSITSMLVMLDAIDEKFQDLPDLWTKLDLVTFYMLDVASMKQTDAIYIKMNSRGRQLTDFEHFKAELLRKAGVAGLKTHDLSLKIDRDWADMLWDYAGLSHIVDSKFLRLFRFVCMIIAYRNGESFPRDKSDFDLVGEYFNLKTAYANFKLLITIFDVWHAVGNLEKFFSDYIVSEQTGHQSGKILDRGLSINPFKTWIDSEDLQLDKFSFLYAFSTVLEHDKNLLGTVDFRRRLRIVSNLIKNSTPNEITDNTSERSHTTNRMPAILKQIDSIMLNGIILTGKLIGTNFLNEPIEEEYEKLQKTSSLSPLIQEKFFEMEDHPIFDGRIKSIGYDSNRFPTVQLLFDKSRINRSLLERALLSKGDYSVAYSAGHQTDRHIATGKGDSDNDWKELLRKIAANPNSNTILLGFIDDIPQPDSQGLQVAINDFIKIADTNKKFDWRYYYIKYPAFQRMRYGFLKLDQHQPYEMLTHFTKQKASQNTEQPFLKCVLGNNYKLGDTLENVTFEERCNMAPYKGNFLSCMNDSWQIRDAQGNVISRLPIPQANGIDTIDRIEYFKANPYPTNWITD